MQKSRNAEDVISADISHGGFHHRLAVLQTAVTLEGFPGAVGHQIPTLWSRARENIQVFAVWHEDDLRARIEINRSAFDYSNEVEYFCFQGKRSHLPSRWACMATAYRWEPSIETNSSARCSSSPLQNTQAWAAPHTWWVKPREITFSTLKDIGFQNILSGRF